MCGPSLPHFLLDVWPEDAGALRREDPGRYMDLEVGVDKDYIGTRVSCPGPPSSTKRFWALAVLVLQLPMVGFESV